MTAARRDTPGRVTLGHKDGKSVEATRYLTDADDIRRAFRLYRDQRSKLVLRFSDNAAMFTARLLDVTDTDLLIEDLQPRSGLPLLRSGTEFSLSCRSQGQFVMVEGNRVYQTSVERGVPYFHVALPTSILYQQRRRDKRLSMSLSVLGNGARMLVHTSDPKTQEPMTLQGDIVDLSAGGCRARFTTVVPQRLFKDALLNDCELQLRKALELKSSVSVRHCHWSKSKQELECGFEFVRMTITDRRRLEQFVQAAAKGGNVAEPGPTREFSPVT